MKKSVRRREARGAISVLLVSLIFLAVVFTVAVGFYAYSASQTYGCFCSDNVKVVTLSSATLYTGTTATGSKEASASLVFSLNNPGPQTTITSITLGADGGLTIPITVWSNTNQSGSAVNFTQGFSINASNALGGGRVTSLTFYPVSNALEAIAPNHTYNYVINFANGDSVSGTLTAVNEKNAFAVTNTSSSTICSYSQYTRTANGTVVTLFSC